jgi:hypothetical protein
MFDESRIAQAANDDAEFRLAARFWNSTIRFDAGDESYRLKIREGKIAEFAPIAGNDARQYDIRISAPREDWHELLKPTPRPFYQDLMAAVWRQGFKLEGDLLGFNPYYQAMNRLLELMRAARA